MTPEMLERFTELARQATGYIYPNELEVHWSIMIVLYPYLTGLVAGAFILASLVKVFNVTEVKPAYRLSLLTALAFLLIAPLPLQMHLGHPERAYEIFLTPNPTSAMAMFGFVYLWYLMLVLLLEIWFAYRKDLILLARREKAPMRWVHRVITLFSNDVSDRAVALDQKVVKGITIIGIPSAFLLHGYVGFIFGSIKANPWWSSVLMPIVFLFSAIVSGIALVILLYMVITPLRGEPIDMRCLDKMASFLFYAVIIDFTLEALDFLHRLYESEESIRILSDLVLNKLMISLVVMQIILGMLIPFAIMVLIKLFNLTADLRKLLYFVTVILIQLGIFSVRWNVVIGGQMFSKSFRGLTTYKMELMGIEGLLSTIVVLALPLIVLAILIKILPPWDTPGEQGSGIAGQEPAVGVSPAGV
jgi:Ni/Fe-hydrogenase subunit HybB-like protein